MDESGMTFALDFHLLSFVALTGVWWVVYKLLLEGRARIRAVYAYGLVGLALAAAVSLTVPVRSTADGTGGDWDGAGADERPYLTVSQIVGEGGDDLPPEIVWPMVYASGAALVLLYVFVQLVALQRSRQRAVRRYALPGHSGVRVYVGAYATPFSYGRSIFVPEYLTDDRAVLHMVLRHEAAHLRRHHFARLLLFQLWVALNWFNPFMWLWLFSMKRVQEMEVDADLLRRGVNRRQYQLSLLQLCVWRSSGLSLRSAYCASPLKQRILFMNCHPHRAGWRAVAAAGVLTVAMAVALACQTRRDNPLKGTWELVGLVNTATGRVEPPAVRQLKFVGNRSFFTMVFFNDSVPDTSILFQGSGGSFEYVSDTVVRERSLDCPVRRIGPDRYRMTWRDLNSNEQFTEEWRRIETPPQLEKYWEIVQ